MRTTLLLRSGVYANGRSLVGKDRDDAASALLRSKFRLYLMLRHAQTPSWMPDRPCREGYVRLPVTYVIRARDVRIVGFAHAPGYVRIQAAREPATGPDTNWI